MYIIEKIHRYRSNSRMVRVSNIFADTSSKVCKNRIQIFPHVEAADGKRTTKN